MSNPSQDELIARQRELALLTTELSIRDARAELAGRRRLLMPLLAASTVLSAVVSIAAAVVTLAHR